MRKVFRFALYGLAGLALLAAFSATAVFGYSELLIRKRYSVPLVPFAAVSDSLSIREGERLARVRGCFGGCHGTTLEGEVFFDEPGVATVVAPNLTEVVGSYSDSELERVIRKGVRKNGRSVFAMPSEMFAGLADEDLSAIIAFLRSQPRVSGSTAAMKVGPMGRVGVTLGLFKPRAPAIQHSQAATVPRHDPMAWGEYIVKTSCTECHGMDLRGDEFTPDLAIAAAFSPQDWEALMTSGRGLGGRELELMGSVAQSRFRYFTGAERDAVRTYLLAMAQDSTLR